MKLLENRAMNDPYRIAQRALADLKAAARQVLASAPEEGLSNAVIGRSLGIYSSHSKQEGHISRSILGMLEDDGVAEQDADTKRWRLRDEDLAADGKV